MSLHLNFEPLKCTACGRCEVACGHYRDEGYTVTSSSIMLYRAEDKKNYFGLLWKTENDLVAARPEGVAVNPEADDSSPGGKPILLRPGCDECDPAPCVLACPTGAVAQ